ncbi:MAG TPA: hypothetical protein VGQ26_12965, partial [Streptosporangiaceae bacterium]|nr:hypothetical protein [Streptosporangiaceae bacterium]
MHGDARRLARAELPGLVDTWFWPKGRRKESRVGWMGAGSKWPRFPPRWVSYYRYWPVASLSVVDTRTATTLARLMIT